MRYSTPIVASASPMPGEARARRAAGETTQVQAGPTAGNSFELDAIAAAFIGGAAVQGGAGKVVGAITGGLIMGVRPGHAHGRAAASTSKGTRSRREPFAEDERPRGRSDFCIVPSAER
jgi:hypothetical protein